MMESGYFLSFWEIRPKMEKVIFYSKIIHTLFEALRKAGSSYKLV